MIENEYRKYYDYFKQGQEHEIQIILDVMTDIMAEIESQDPADYGRTPQEISSAESMKQNILEIIKRRIKK